MRGRYLLEGRQCVGHHDKLRVGKGRGVETAVDHKSPHAASVELGHVAAAVAAAPAKGEKE